MQHPFLELKPEYERLLGGVIVTRAKQAARAADEVDRHLDTYVATAKVTRIPALWIGCTDYRESDCDPRTGIGQGDRWDRVSTHVPRGCGPFRSKAEADVFYLRHDHIDDLRGSSTWTLAYALWAWEKWNGFGPRGHGRISGYPFSGTQWYDEPPSGIGKGGKYVADGIWDQHAEDAQVGTLPVYLELARRHPELAIEVLVPVPAPPIVPPVNPVPIGVGGGDWPAEWVQKAINAVGIDMPPTLLPLRVDDNYGRRTREAVRRYQRARGLEADGLVGDMTGAALKVDLANMGIKT